MTTNVYFVITLVVSSYIVMWLYAIWEVIQ